MSTNKNIIIICIAYHLLHGGQLNVGHGPACPWRDTTGTAACAYYGPMRMLQVGQFGLLQRPTGRYPTLTPFCGGETM